MKVHIYSYIPIVSCQYCGNKVITFKKYNIYCSNKCNLYHTLIILYRINQILLLYLLFQIKLILIMLIKLSFVGMNISIIYMSLQLIYSFFYAMNNIDLIICYDYH